MDDWKDIKINGIGKIDKCIAEFQVWETNKTPYGKFKVKVFERTEDSFIGFTNIMVKNPENGDSEGGIGFGKNVTEALEDTLINFMDILNNYEDLSENDFDWSHPDDF